jgi:hypothetical protein
MRGAKTTAEENALSTSRPIFAAILAVALAAAACNMPASSGRPADSDATAAALTVQAQLTAAAPSATATSPAIPPTNTPAALPVASATSAATATSNCDASQFITDVTIPDGYVLAPGEGFTKTWRLKNTGTCSWTSSYSIVYSSGTQMNGPSTQALAGNVNPGQTVDLSINLTAPASPGNYTGYWKLRNASGTLFAQFYVQIKVQTGGGDSDDEDFAVTSVTYTVSTFDQPGFDDCPKVTAHITANGAGDVGYHWTRSDGAGAPDESLHFNSAGTKDVSETWTLGSVWAGGAAEWLGIYIDAPNHQDFGHVNVPACVSP